MSGFEAAGLALALFPIVIEIVDAYSGMISGRDIRHLAESLRNQQQIFLNSVEYLLRSTVPASELAALMSDLGGASWKNTELVQSVEDQLGSEAVRILNATGDIYKTVLKLSQKLPVSTQHAPALLIQLLIATRSSLQTATRPLQSVLHA